MTPDEPEVKKVSDEQSYIMGMLVLAFLISAAMLAATSAMDYFAGIHMIDNYRLWAFSPFFLTAGVTMLFGIVRWGVYFGMSDALTYHASKVEENLNDMVDSLDPVDVDPWKAVDPDA